MGWWGGVVVCAMSFSCLTQLKVMLGLVELGLSWGFDNFSNSVKITDLVNYDLVLILCG